MNVIFLDIDGVLVTTRTFIMQRGFHRKGLPHEFDIVGAGILAALCEEFNAKIVISSTWRLGAVMSELDFMPARTMLYKNLKATELLPFLHTDWRTKDLYRHTEGLVRGDEIKEWLKRHPEVTNYAILDDDSDMLDEQLSKFVNTDANEGITYKTYLDVENIFKNAETTTNA